MVHEWIRPILTPSVTLFLGPTSLRSKLHLCCFSRCCRPHERDQEIQRQTLSTPFVAIGRVYLLLESGLRIHQAALFSGPGSGVCVCVSEQLLMN